MPIQKLNIPLTFYFIYVILKIYYVILSKDFPFLSKRYPTWNLRFRFAQSMRITFLKKSQKRFEVKDEK